MTNDLGAAPPLTPPPRGRRIVGAGITLVVIAVAFAGVLPAFADYDAVLETVMTLRLGQLAIIGFLAAWFLVAYWLVLMVAIPSLRLVEAAVNHSAGTAVTNTVPTGGALAVGVNYAMYVSWGFTPHVVTSGVLTAGLFDNLVKWGLPIVTFGLLAAGSGSTGLAWAVPMAGLGLLAVALVVLGLVLRSDGLAERIGRTFDRIADPVLRRLRRPSLELSHRTVFLRQNIVTLLRGRWHLLTIATVGQHAAMFLVLFACLRFVGVGAQDLSWLTMMAGFSVARLLSAVPITPGGVGVVDAGYVAILSLDLATSSLPAVVAGVLLFRALTFFPPIPLGLGAWMFWRSNDSWRRDWRVAKRGEIRASGSKV